MITLQGKGVFGGIAIGEIAFFKRDYEFRTTVVRELHDEENFREIGAWLSGCSRYYLQPYRESEHILASMQNPESCFHAPDTESLHRYIEILKKTIPNVELRGKDIK